MNTGVRPSGIAVTPYLERGVRVEDTVVVGQKGPKVLTGYPRNLER